MALDLDQRPVLPRDEIKAVLSPVLDEVEAAVRGTERPRLEQIHAALPAFLSMSVRSARETWNVVDVAYSKAGFEAGIRWESAVAMPALVRTFVDGASATIFIFERPAERMQWYLKSTWREMMAEYERKRARYAGDAEWDAWLAKIKVEIDLWEPLAGITAAEKQRPASIDWWPNPGGMRRGTADATRLARLTELAATFYGHLSGAAHLSGTGALMQGGSLQPEQALEFKQKYFSDQVMTGLTMLFAWTSELIVEATTAAELRTKMRHLWGLLGSVWKEGAELYAQRYAARLT